MTQPNDQPPPAAVHVDLDGTRSIYNIHGWRDPGEDDPLYETGLANLLAFLAAERVRATLFVIARDLEHPRRRALLEQAVSAGHELASHSLTHPRFDGLDAASRRREVFESKARLEDAFGVAIRGFRTPNFEVDRATLELVREAGYAWDSSCFPTPAFARRMGLERVPLHPFEPLDGGGLLELPLPAYRPLPLPFHASYVITLGIWYLRLGLARFRRTGAPCVHVFHLTDLADPLPAALLPGAKARFFTLSYRSARTKRAVCARVLHELRRRYTLGTTDELLGRATPAG